MSLIHGLRALMRQTITIEPFQGNTGAEAQPSYGAGVQRKARILHANRLVRDMDGREVLSSSQAMVDLEGLAASVETRVRDRVMLPDDTEPRRPISFSASQDSIAIYYF